MTGLQGVTCGRLATVVLHTVDHFGNPKVCGGEEVTAQLHGGPSRGIPSTVQVLSSAHTVRKSKAPGNPAAIDAGDVSALVPSVSKECYNRQREKSKCIVYDQGGG